MRSFRTGQSASLARLAASLAAATIFLSSIQAQAQTAAGQMPSGNGRPVPPQYFEGWAVGCDNVLRCEAVSLGSDGGGDLLPVIAPDDRLPMVEVQIVRDAGPEGGAEVRVRSIGLLPDRIRLMADGRQIAELRAGSRGEPVLAGPMALGAVRAMAGAVTIDLRDRKRRPVGAISSAGLTSALRLIDSRQGRTGTVTALIARGEQPAGIVPPAPAMPQVPQLPAPDADTAAPLTPAELRQAMVLAQCDAGLAAQASDALYPLDRDSELLLLPCEAGPYNVSAVALVARGAAGARSMSIARFDHPPGATGAPGKPPLVVNALWDARRGILSSLAKGRGAGDCGASEDYVWDGTMFRLVESRAMHVCRGAADWIRVWIARPVAVDAPPGDVAP